MEGGGEGGGLGKGLCPKRDANVLGLGFSRCWVRVTEIVYSCECAFFLSFFFLSGFVSHFFFFFFFLIPLFAPKCQTFFVFWGWEWWGGGQT